VDTYKNAVQLQVSLGENCLVHLILGNNNDMQDIINNIVQKV